MTWNRSKLRSLQRALLDPQVGVDTKVENIREAITRVGRLLELCPWLEEEAKELQPKRGPDEQKRKRGRKAKPTIHHAHSKQGASGNGQD